MSLKQRQKFLLSLVSDEKALNAFLAGKAEASLSKNDLKLIRTLNADGLRRKAGMLRRKKGLPPNLEGA